jgi:dipeptidyl aminopeptidase/acylaminoacyl peptidase
MHDALKALGRDVDLLVFADEGHGLAKLENRAIAWQRELEFMRKNLEL